MDSVSDLYCPLPCGLDTINATCTWSVCALPGTCWMCVCVCTTRYLLDVCMCVHYHLPAGCVYVCALPPTCWMCVCVCTTTYLLDACMCVHYHLPAGCVYVCALPGTCWMCICSEQDSLKRMLSQEDSPEVLSWRDPHGGRFAGLRLVGGVDISFNKSDPDKACAIVVVLSFPQLKVTSLPSCRAQFVVWCVLQCLTPWTTPPPPPRWWKCPP